ncbi:alkaline phosphatase family protein [Georgenia yuyongxinii]|uniref:Alkaline phosphatase family protein n=1 Tax=Georgenia yuyongxinii TaxID=2589797 RepID=A0A5B8BYP5_9MICO|nr:alkaline phosphatase family protein [Georgenia yuyongxinii]QDC23454.1 alkaline phosphatase family protein [Georgenia yuyongxinii]
MSSTQRRQRQRRRATILALVVALALVLPFVLPLLSAVAAPAARTTASGASAVSATAASTAPTATTGAATTPAGAVTAEAPLVVIGTTGVRWQDLSALATPNMWQLAQQGASANMVVRSVRSSTCPADGWLALSAGRRAADVPMEEFGTCRDLPPAREDGAVPGWADYLGAADAASYDATPGLLGDTLAAAGVTSVAVGPGAAVALATSAGTVAGDHAFASTSSVRMGAQVAQALPGHALAVIDVGSVRDRNRPLVSVPSAAGAPTLPEEPEPAETPTLPAEEAWLLKSPERGLQVAAVDARVGAVLDAVRTTAPAATVLLASLADSGSVALMQMVTAAGPAMPTVPAGGALLDTRSTRQPGMVQSTDLTPTVLGMLGVDVPAGLAGAPFSAVEDGRSGPARVAHLVDVNRHAVEIRSLVGPFYSALVLVNLLLYGVVTLGLNRRMLDGTAARLEARGGTTSARMARALRSRRPVPLLRALRTAAVVVGAVPVATYLANLLPWWRAGSPGLALYGATVVLAVAVAAVALLGPWRRRLLAPVAVVAGLTAVLLAVDVLTGARLQVSSLMGVQPQVGGRFYGFNNSSFSLFAASTILVAMCLTDPLVRRGRRVWAAAVIAVVGVVATVLDGAPSIGADFGGPPALIPGFLVLGLLAMGVRLTWRRIAVVLAVTAVAAISFSVVDWLRPPSERSHLGRFIETVLDGGLWSVITRKAAQNLTNLFGSTLTLLAIGGIVLVVMLLTRPLRTARGRDVGGHGSYGWLTGGNTIGRIDRDAVMLRPTLVALGVTFAIAFAVNDSGIVLPAIGTSLAVPLLVAVVTGWLLQHGSVAAPAPASPEMSSSR